MGVSTLDFLLDHDWSLLSQVSRRRSFHREEVILPEGAQEGVFVVRGGFVRVERSAGGIVLARLGPGAVFGEMSFLENQGASASVIADDEVAVEHFSPAHLLALLNSDPGFSARFYQSLAVELARRLRERSKRLPPLNVQDVTQVNRFHKTRIGQISQQQMPAELIAIMDSFKTTMFHIDQALRGPRAPDGIQGQLDVACDSIVEALKQYCRPEALLETAYDDPLAFRDPEQLAIGIGAYVFRETFSWFMSSAALARYYMKPRGYADDYETIEMVYENEPDGDGRLGPLIDRWFLSRPVNQSRRASRRLMADLLARAAPATGKPFRVTSLASGTARDIFDLVAQNRGLDPRATCVDLDPSALLFARNSAAELRCAEGCTFIQADVLGLIRGEIPVSLEPQQAIATLGFCDYLEDDQVLLLLSWAHANLGPGGTAIVSNLDPATPDRLFMEHVLEWEVLYRDEAQLRALFSRSPFAGSPVDIARDKSGCNVFARATKR